MPATETQPRAADRQPLPRLSFGPFTFDTRTRLLNRDGLEVPLPPRVVGVLELLLQRAGDVVARQELIDTVWKDAFVTDTSLAEAVSVLRQALVDDSQSPTYIQTLHRRGYRFVAPVSAVVPGTPVLSEVPAAADSSTGAVAAAEEVVSPSIGGELVPWSAAIICAVIAVTAVWQLTRSREATVVPAARFAVSAAPGTTFDGLAPALAMAPDGSQIAWSACDAAACRLYVRQLDRLEPTAIAGTDGAHAPFYSPDGRWIAFFADGRIKKVALAGGAPVTLADAPSILGGAWIANDIVFAGSPTGGLLRVPATGGEPRPLTVPRETEGEVGHAWPAAVPGSNLLLFTIATIAPEDAPGLVGVLSFDPRSSADRVAWRTIASGAGLARTAAPDAFLVSRGAELEAITLDATRVALSGTPRTVLSGVATARGRSHVALSQTGSIVWLAQGAQQTQAGLSRWSPAGFQPLPDEMRRLRGASLSPDGTRVAGINVEGARADVWIADVRRGTAARLTHSGVNSSPAWSADGRTIYFASRTSGAFELWKRDADGLAPASRVEAAPDASRHSLPQSVSPDGRSLLFVRTDPARRADVWALPLAGGSAQPIVQGAFDDSAAAVSPDSSFVAFASADTGRWEIYVQSLRDGRRAIVSSDGGERPVWSANGLYFQSGNRVMRAVLTFGESPRVDRVDTVADIGPGRLRGVAPDGRLLVDRDTDTAPATAIVSLEWLREVRALLGPPAAALPR